VAAGLKCEHSDRCDKALVTKNCGTLQKDLLRSELFGYRKGAFTGADDSYEGVLAFAHGGTLFLDEIGELSPDVQSALLRVIENQTFRRVGEREQRRVDVRFVFATNRDLQAEVMAGRFSEAMFHRLNVFNIGLPSLRSRKADLPALIEHFLGRLAPGDRQVHITDRALQYLMAYAWPGNVRELRNVLERGIILSEGDLITEKCLPLDMVVQAADTTVSTPFPTLEEVEQQHIRAVMQYVNGNRTRAAQILGIGRKTLYREMQNMSA
jgi:two-component system NtrC family response regulator